MWGVHLFILPHNLWNVKCIAAVWPTESSVHTIYISIFFLYDTDVHMYNVQYMYMGQISIWIFFQILSLFGNFLTAVYKPFLHFFNFSIVSIGSTLANHVSQSRENQVLGTWKVVAEWPKKPDGCSESSKLTMLQVDAIANYTLRYWHVRKEVSLL